MSKQFRMKPGKPFSVLSVPAVLVLAYFSYDAIHHYLTQPDMVAQICKGAQEMFGITGQNFLVYILGGGAPAPVLYFGITGGLMEAGLLILAYVACVMLMFHTKLFFRGAVFWTGIVIIASAFFCVVAVIPVIILILYSLIRDIFAAVGLWDSYETVEYYIGKFTVILILGALMAILMLAAGGKQIPIAKQIFSSVYASELWPIIGGFFSLFVLPGTVVSYTLIHNRIVGAIMFVLMLTCGFIGGINAWWIACAILIILSFLCFLNENTGKYDVMTDTEKICVIFPAAGALRFIERFFLDDLFNVICGILSVLSALLALALPVIVAFGTANIEAGTVLGQNPFLTGLCEFASGFFGTILIRVFLPLFSVLTFKYVFGKPLPAKITAIAACGLNLYRGAIIVITIIAVTSTDTVTLSGEGAFGNIFGVDFSALMLITLGSLLCIYIAFTRKDDNILIRYVEGEPGSKSANAMTVSGVASAVLVLVAPVITGILYIIMCIVMMFVVLGMLSSRPLGYAELRRNGCTHEQACRRCGLDPRTAPRVF